ncbi:DUF7510 family protein [Halobaculum magnesiiphilum]|uniref:Uncharacterized protein n=1 Tax=Halobaculum magnesiiphilum TaxID=1017351 RepID=A0A8T8WEA9_9EURY|nr:hypothetical protein [Halobaculum magnesiiphilum]QZP38175.1 hypothetical protein K6T50_03160 [Halobaculum magnesiiphilum]
MDGNGEDAEDGRRETDGSDRPVSVDVEIADGRTVIVVTGDRDAAVVVESASGERIYLPPEDFERPPESEDGARQDAYGTGPRPSDSPYQSATSDSPYQSATSDSPYQSPGESDSPYQRGGPAPDRVGLEPTADGFRIVHPEPVTDFRLLR